jgi:hypothetical protein
MFRITPQRYNLFPIIGQIPPTFYKIFVVLQPFLPFLSLEIAFSELISLVKRMKEHRTPAIQLSLSCLATETWLQHN